jgi:hypothetical protein
LPIDLSYILIFSLRPRYKRLFSDREFIEFPVGSFIEDVFFNSKIDAYPRFGTFILSQNIGPVTYHLSGRKLALNEAGERQKLESAQVKPSRDSQRGSGSAVEGGVDGAAQSSGDIEDTSMVTSDENSRNQPRDQHQLRNAHAKDAREVIGGQFEMFQAMPSRNAGKKFSGRCFKCGEKGHSARMCPMTS